jgi:elongation factor 1-alpha
VVSAKDGVQSQTKEHAFLAKVLGIGQFMILINKMDAINYDEKRYNEVKAELEKLLKGMGYDISKLVFIPTSGYKGDNISKNSENTPYYKGPALLAVLDSFTVPPKLGDKPLRLPIQDVFTITGHGTVPVGRIETGSMKVNEKVVFMPSGATGEVKKIEMHHQEMAEAKCGDNVGFNVKGVDKKDIKRGDVLGSSANPPTVADEFTAQVVVLNHPTAISVGYTPVLHIHTAQFAAKIIEIVEKKGQEGKVDFIKTGDVAVVKFKPLKPIVIEKYAEFPPLGRFAIRDMGQTVAAGVVLDVVPKKQ